MPLPSFSLFASAPAPAPFFFLLFAPAQYLPRPQLNRYCCLSLPAANVRHRSSWPVLSNTGPCQTESKREVLADYHTSVSYFKEQFVITGTSHPATLFVTLRNKLDWEGPVEVPEAPQALQECVVHSIFGLSPSPYYDSL